MPASSRRCARRARCSHREKVTHSYMHCWRHKTPIIYRATTQWFAGMDDVPGYRRRQAEGDAARDGAARHRGRPRSFPSWGKARLHGMIANRPDWTLSRQRQWGVPMPFFVDKETGALHPRTLELLERVAQAVEQGGIEAWQGDHSGGTARRGREALRESARHARRLVRFGHHAPDGAGRPGRAQTGTGSHAQRDAVSRPTSTSKARTSIAAGSIRRCSCRAC